MLEIVELDVPHPYPPRISDFTRPFWEGLADGRLLTTRSRSTGRLTFPPKPISPVDWADDMEWTELTPTGVLYSHTTIHAAPQIFVRELPYSVCIVDLDDGLRIVTRYLGETPAIGQRVRVVAVRYTDAMSFAVRADDDDRPGI